MTGSANPGGGDYVAPTPDHARAILTADAAVDQVRMLSAERSDLQSRLATAEAKCERLRGEVAEARSEWRQSIEHGETLAEVLSDLEDDYRDQRAERDQARGIAVTLEQELAEVLRVVRDYYEWSCSPCPPGGATAVPFMALQRIATEAIV